MGKEKVLEIEFLSIFDKKVVWRVVYQNEKVFKRGDFIDDSIGVASNYSPCFDCDILFIRGSETNNDDYINICTKGEAEIIKEKVKAINEKYGIPKRWRAEKGEEYYYINPFFKASSLLDNRDKTDNNLYDLKNYFKTKEEAEKIIEQFMEILQKRGDDK